MKPFVLIDWLSRPLQGVDEVKRLALLDRACLVGADERGVVPLGQSPKAIAKLSPRQREVLNFLAKGLLTKEIASLMNVSQNTVENHCRMMYRTLGVHSKMEAVRLVFSFHVG